MIGTGLACIAFAAVVISGGILFYAAVRMCNAFVDLCKSAKEFSETNRAKLFSEALRQTCYDAVAYSVEQVLKNGEKEEDRMPYAVDFLRKIFPDMSEETAVFHLESIQAKLVGVGRNPGGKIQ